MNSLLVRCSLRSVVSAKGKIPVYWAIQHADQVKLLSPSVTLSSMHNMDWNSVESQVESELAKSDVVFHPLYDDRPDKVIGIGLNYRDHLEEQNVPPDKYPKDPVIFNKFPSTIITHEASIVHPTVTDSLDYEAELAVVIGQQGRYIKEENAMEHVFGYSVANDITARDWQKTKNNKQWILGKSMDTFCPLGPGICPKSFIKDPHSLDIKCEINGEVRQQSNTSNLLFNIPHLIAYVSKLVTLYPGDVILTGTPGGVGAFRDPPLFLKPGDRIDCTVEKIGTLSNKVVGEGAVM